MNLEPKTLKNLVIITFVLSIFAIIFSMWSMSMCYDGTTIIDHKEFDSLHPGIKKLYKRIVLNSNGIKPYIDKINNKYEKAVESAGGEREFNDSAVESIKKYVDTNPFFKLN